MEKVNLKGHLTIYAKVNISLFSLVDSRGWQDLYPNPHPFFLSGWTMGEDGRGLNQTAITRRSVWSMSSGPDFRVLFFALPCNFASTFLSIRDCIAFDQPLIARVCRHTNLTPRWSQERARTSPLLQCLGIRVGGLRTREKVPIGAVDARH